MVEQLSTSLTFEEKALASLYRLGNIRSKWLLIDILRFASTEKYQADLYLFQACRGSRRLLMKCDTGISLYKFLVINHIPLPMPALYIVPRKERGVLKAMLVDEGNTLGELLYNAKIDGWSTIKFH